MIVYVGNDIEKALQGLKKAIARDGYLRELRTRSHPKRSVRRGFKEGLAAKRRRQGEERRRIAEFNLTI